MRQRSRRSPHRRAITFEGTTINYGEFQDRIDRTATVLRDCGVREGDRVGYLGFNHPALLETLFAAARLGAIFVPLNFRLTSSELEFIINDAGCRTIVADSDHTEILDSVRDSLCIRHWLSIETDSANWTDLIAARESAAPIGATPFIDSESVAVIMYTSGTTGLPKGSMLTHANIWWNNSNMTNTVDLLEDDVSLVFAPLFHIGGLNVITLVSMQRGAEIVIHRHFDPDRALEDIPKYGVTTIFGVPAMFLFISQVPAFGNADLTSVRLLVCGGAPVPEPLMKVYASRGIPISQGYGLTETSPSVAFLTNEFGITKIGSAGKSPLFSELKLVDDAGNTISDPGTIGEICAQGPNIMKGYWNRPEATAEAIDENGWFHTGDVGYLDNEGFLYITDRIKDMVISGGENVYPAEVENALYEHPSIVEVAVVGLPDERWGEAVTAVVVMKDGEQLELDELREFADDKLARYKLPTRLLTINEIPRNASGKVLKRELRSQFG
jgi:fatty-acyl-CoA synthase